MTRTTDESLRASDVGEGFRVFGLLIVESARLYASRFERHGQELSLTLAQCKVLAFLSRNEGTSQARLAELSDTDPTTLFRLLDRMQADKWIERRQDRLDRRAHRLFLGAAAKPVLERMWKIADRCRLEAMSGLKPGERERLVELLGRVRDTLSGLVPRSKILTDGR